MFYFRSVDPRSNFISLFSSVQIWSLKVKVFFCCSFWLICCPLGPHIFADPGRQNLADPDAKH